MALDIINRPGTAADVRQLLPGRNGPISGVTLNRYIAEEIIPPPSTIKQKRRYWPASQMCAIAARINAGEPLTPGWWRETETAAA